MLLCAPLDMRFAEKSEYNNVKDPSPERGKNLMTSRSARTSALVGATRLAAAAAVTAALNILLHTPAQPSVRAG
eukprot:m.435089 g.435089  ORF g.435089 m.435089 type:complete len:74 (+) comp17810_c0_seq1:856-1077(+)